MTTCNLAVLDDVFERLGGYVQWWYDLSAMKETLENRLADAATQFEIGGAASDEDEQAYAAFSAEIRRQKASIESLRYSVVNLVSYFLGRNAKDLLDAPYSSVTQILDHLLDVMDDSEDAVLENTVDVGTVTEDEDNTVTEDDGLTLPTMDDPPTQMARDDNFSLVCTDDTVVDGEKWALYSGRLGQYIGSIVTGTEVDWTAAGISDLDISEAPVHSYRGLVQDETTDDYLENWCLEGLRRGENTDAGGQIYIEILPGGPPYTVTLYKDDAGSNAVAEGTWSSAAKTTVTLTELNDSGLSGTVDITWEVLPGVSDQYIMQKVYDYQISGAQRGKNISEDGQVWMQLVDQAASSVDAYDEYSQLSGWGFSARVFGDETDGSGKVYVSVVKEPSSYTVRGGTKAIIDASSIIIDNADDTNTDDGTLYAKVTQDVNSDGTRDFTVELYSDSSRNTREASGSVSSVADTEFPVEIELDADTGGVSGSLELDAFNSTQDGAIDSSVQIEVPRYFVRLYRDSGRDEEDLISEGAIFEPAGSVQLNSVGSYSTAGGVTLNYVQDDNDIELTMNFYYMDMYKADPDDSDTTEDDLVARAGRDSSSFHGDGGSNILLHATNNSGLTDVTVDLAYHPVDAGFVTSIKLGYSEGDKFLFSTSVTDDSSYTPGRFQTFLRDSYSKVFPSAPEGTSNTVPDSWAGAS